MLKTAFNFQSIHKRITLSESKNLFVFSLIFIIIGVLLRWKSLEFQSLWYDELGSLSYYNSSKTFLEIVNTSLADYFPPLYNIILWVTYKLTGDYAYAGRYLSACFGSINLLVFYSIGKLLGGNKTALWVVVVTSLNPYLIYLSQEGRPYALFCLLSTLSFFYLLKFFNNNSVKNFYLLCIWSSFSLLTHLLAFLNFGLIGLVLLTINKKNLRTGIKLLVHYLAVSIIISIVAWRNAFHVTGDYVNGLRKWGWMKSQGTESYNILSLLKHFFGFENLGLYIISIVSCALFIRLYKARNSLINLNPTIWVSLFFAFILLIMVACIGYGIEPRYCVFFVSILLIDYAWIQSKLKTFFGYSMFLNVIFFTYVIEAEWGYFRQHKKQKVRQALEKLELIASGLPIGCISNHSSGFLIYAKHYNLKIGLGKREFQSKKQNFYIISNRLSKLELDAYSPYLLEPYGDFKQNPILLRSSYEMLQKMPASLRKMIDFSCSTPNIVAKRSAILLHANNQEKKL